MRTQGINRGVRGGLSVAHRPATTRLRCFASSSNGHSAAAQKPPPAETARTIVSIVSEGTLSTLSADGWPVGTPVSFTMDKQGAAWVTLPQGAPELKHLKANSR